MDNSLQTLDRETPAAFADPGLDDFSRLLAVGFTPTSESARSAVEVAVRTLAEQALADTTLIRDEARQTIETVIAAIDRKLSEQVNEVLHHPDFQALESAWRGLHYLVNYTETDEMLKIRVFNLSKKELQRCLRKYKGTAWDQS